MNIPARLSMLLTVLVLASMSFLAAPPACADDTKGEIQPQTQPVDQEQAFWAAYRAGQWEQAISIGMKLEASHPESPLIAYNLACLHSLAGRADVSLEWLSKAADRGFTDIETARNDPDFGPLRGGQAFKDVLARIEQNKKQDLEAVRQLFAKRPPKIILPPKYDPKIPTGVLISLHGYGGRATGYPMYWRKAAADFNLILVAPQAVHRVDGTVGYAWGDMDETEFLMDITLQALREQYVIDEKRIIISGFSQGGFLAGALAARSPELYFGSIPMAGPHYPRVKFPSRSKDARAPRFYFMVGEHDRLRPDAERASKYYTELGYTVQYTVYEAPGHTYPVRNNHELSAALTFIFTPEPEPAPETHSDDAI